MTCINVVDLMLQAEQVADYYTYCQYKDSKCKELIKGKNISECCDYILENCILWLNTLDEKEEFKESLEIENNIISSGDLEITLTSFEKALELYQRLKIKYKYIDQYIFYISLTLRYIIKEG